MHFTRMIGFVLTASSFFSSTTVASPIDLSTDYYTPNNSTTGLEKRDNCKGSSSCGFMIYNRDNFARYINSLPDNAHYRKGQRVICQELSDKIRWMFIYWAAPFGFCLIAKGDMEGKLIKDNAFEILRQCSTCGSVDTPKGELTINYVADIRKGCPGAKSRLHGLYKSGLCNDGNFDPKDVIDAPLLHEGP